MDLHARAPASRGVSGAGARAAPERPGTPAVRGEATATAHRPVPETDESSLAGGTGNPPRTEPGAHRLDTWSTADPVLSVVIVTYEEADRIGACVESVLAACRDGPAFEVLLVDSNSTDGTVEVARKYPISVLQIPSDDLTTPAAGRFVGTEAVAGEYVLFVDGDVELTTTGWLHRALEWLRAYDDVAGIDGHLDDSPAAAVQPASMLHGVALYDADALAAVGGFDPFLQSLEDVDLGVRLRDRGYRLLRFPDVVGHHPGSPGVSEVLRRWHNGYYYGLGQVVRRSATTPSILVRFLARYRHPLAFQAWLAVGVGAVVVGLTPVLAWLGLSIGLFVADAAWEGLDSATYRCLEYGLMAVGFVRGLVLGSRNASAFPLEAAVPVQTHRGVQTGPAEDPAPRAGMTPDGGEGPERATRSETGPT